MIFDVLDVLDTSDVLDALDALDVLNHIKLSWNGLDLLDVIIAVECCN